MRLFQANRRTVSEAVFFWSWVRQALLMWRLSSELDPMDLIRLICFSWLVVEIGPAEYIWDNHGFARRIFKEEIILVKFHKEVLHSWLTFSDGLTEGWLGWLVMIEYSLWSDDRWGTPENVPLRIRESFFRFMHNSVHMVTMLSMHKQYVTIGKILWTMFFFQEAHQGRQHLR